MFDLGESLGTSSFTGNRHRRFSEREVRHVFPRIFNRVTEHCDGMSVRWNPHHGTATLNFCTCTHLIYLTRPRQATPIRPRCREQQVEMCPKGSYHCIAPSVSPCLPELCLSSGSIRLSGVTAHNICVAVIHLCPLFIPRPLDATASFLQPDLPCIPSD